MILAFRILGIFWAAIALYCIFTGKDEAHPLTQMMLCLIFVEAMVISEGRADA